MRRPADIPFPIITPRLLLRPMMYADASQLHDVYGDAEAMRYLMEEVPGSIDETKGWMAPKIAQQDRDGFSLWAVVERSTGAVIGDCGLQYLDDGPDVEVGCRLARRHWNKGYATEAGVECLRVGFEHLGLDRILSVTAPDNLAGQRCLEKMGMRYVGIGRHWGAVYATYMAARDGWLRSTAAGARDHSG
jgi:ribosomal-protein-alanine N-acetyltransferase